MKDFLLRKKKKHIYMKNLVVGSSFLELFHDLNKSEVKTEASVYLKETGWMRY